MSWRPIKDEIILHRWRCVKEDNTVCEIVEVSPDWYEEHGTPVCICGEDMEYVETLLDCKFDPMRETLVIPIKKERQKNGS